MAFEIHNYRPYFDNQYSNVNYVFFLFSANNLENNHIKHCILLKNEVRSNTILKFEDKIKQGYSKAKFSNMANFYTSLMIAKNEDEGVEVLASSKFSTKHEPPFWHIFIPSGEHLSSYIEKGAYRKWTSNYNVCMKPKIISSIFICNI